MREMCFQQNTEFSVTTTAIRHSSRRATAKLELTFASGSLRLTFRDPASLIVLLNALSQLSFDADDPDDAARRKIRTRVFCREKPLGSPDPAESRPPDDF